VHINIDDVECPYCGSTDVEGLNQSFVLYRCAECAAHFEEQDEVDTPPRALKQRKMRHHKYKEDE
jgi:DNA-directed RNA polymerase subunit RPC12/RpoP